MAEKRIYIRAWYGPYKEVTREEAKRFCRRVYDEMNCQHDKKVRLINKEHLAGITFEELMKE